MANKRMFTMKIVDSDAFLDMPLSTQCLYFHLNMRADDDGFVDNVKRIIKIVGASDDDLRLLVAKRFVLTFDDSGVIVIKHWRMHNTLSSGRYHETDYIDEKAMLKLKRNGAYSFTDGTDLDDSRLIEQAGRQVRRTKDERKTNADKDLGLDKDLDKGLEKEKDIKESDTNVSPKKSSGETALIEAMSKYNISDYLFDYLFNWIEYKKERNFRYKDRGLNTLIKTIGEKARQYGDEAVAKVIDESISNGYQGILWDRIGKQTKSKGERNILNEWRDA